MEYSVKKLPKSQVEIKVTLTAEELKPFEDKAAVEISKEVKVKGFREGHVPKEVLAQHVDQKHIDAHTHELAIQKYYVDIVMKENLQVVSRPQVKIESENPLTFTATAPVMPEVEIKDHKSIKIEKKEPKVSEKDIEAVVNDMKKYGTTYKDVDREAKKGDKVELDFEGFDEEGKPVENTKSTNHPVILGEGMLIPGFEDHVVGMKKDGNTEFDVTFPKDYHKKDFQHKKMHFRAALKRVTEPLIPDLNEELIERMTGIKQTPDDFKKELEKRILAQKISEHQKERENKFFEELLKRTKIELPDALIEEELDYLIHDIQHELSEKGITFEKFLEQTKTTEAGVREKYKSEAEKRVKLRLALRHLIKEHQIDPTEAEIQTELTKLKSSYPKDQTAKIDAEFAKGPLKGQIINILALQKLLTKVLE